MPRVRSLVVTLAILKPPRKTATSPFIIWAILLGFWHVVCCQIIRMILSAEASEIVAYLKTANGKFVNLAEISRRAGGKRRFEEKPDWAKNHMSPLVDAGLLEVNARGHYRVPPSRQAQAQPQPQPSAKPESPPPPRDKRGKVLGDDYFPSSEETRIVAGDYFPTSD